MVATYEDSTDPAIAVAPLGSDLPSCGAWVREHDEFMMVPSSEGRWTLVYLAADGYAKFEGQPFWHTVGKQEAARQMRIWIGGLASRGEV
jgi:hypothetical protein